MPAASASLLTRRLSSRTASTSVTQHLQSVVFAFPARSTALRSSLSSSTSINHDTATLCSLRRKQQRFSLGSTSSSPSFRRPAPPRAVKRTFSSFDDMIKESDVPVLVDFHATWCGPCKVMAQSVADCAQSMQGSVKVVKVDTDAYPALATRFNVRALPTLLLFVDGEAVDRVEGVLAGPQLTDRVRYYSKRLDKKFGRR